jgi:SAM-dependent methyltransferase
MNPRGKKSSNFRFFVDFLFLLCQQISMEPIYIFLYIILAIFLWINVVVRIMRKIHPFPIPEWFIYFIDNPFRRAIQKPTTIARNLHLKPGMKILEIGPGKATYTKGVAKEILPDGIVYTIDIQDKLIEKVKKNLEKEGISNIIPQVEDAYNLSFEDEFFDRIFMVACLPEIPDQVKTLKECKRVLKADGIISTCEILVDPDYPLRKTEIKWANAAGLQLKEKLGNFCVYQLNFVK